MFEWYVSGVLIIIGYAAFQVNFAKCYQDSKFTHKMLLFSMSILSWLAVGLILGSIVKAVVEE